MKQNNKIIRLLAGLIMISVAVLVGCQSSSEKQAQGDEAQLWTCGMHPEVIQSEPGNCPICEMKLTPVKKERSTKADSQMDMKTDGKMAADQSAQKDRKVLYWRAPMDPSYTSDKPGKSPMGMDLVPVYEDDEPQASGDVIRIDPEVVLNIGVKTAPVEVKKLRSEIRTVAHVDYNEETLSRVNMKFSGWVEKLYVDFQQSQGNNAQHKELFRRKLTTDDFGMLLSDQAIAAGTEFSLQTSVPWSEITYPQSNIRIVTVIWKKDGNRYLAVNTNYTDFIQDGLVSTNERIEPDLTLQIWPNPLEDQGSLWLKNPVQLQRLNIDLFDRSGRLIKNLFNGQVPAGENNLPFSVAGLPQGSYLIRATTATESIARWAVVK